ncbi:hypothetical protein HYFRA_00000120 [Hymenoscyphus fraxineus]|uniref:Uncharacterized protein n=1 Tax=Hymenoscyphus fraxineus TaxID=746836 RepID=A0A9N9L5A0_9HELO|nr:hypothetical protein HYFRA_00000120 [Hymenoscyphus fraxineus]
MKFSYTPLLDRKYNGDDSPDVRSRKVWNHRRSVKVFTSTPSHQDTLRCYASIPRGMYSVNHKLAAMDRDRHNQFAWHKYGNSVSRKELFPTLPGHLVPDCDNHSKHISKKQTRGAQAVRRKRTLVSRTFKRISREGNQRIDSSDTPEFVAVQTQELHPEPGNSQLRTGDAIQKSSTSCQREGTVQKAVERNLDCFEELDWVDIEDEDIFEARAAEADIDDEYVWV